MADDPEWWRNTISMKEFQRRLAEGTHRRKQKEAESKKKQIERQACYDERLAEAGGDYEQRNWNVWRRYNTDNLSCAVIAREFGVSPSRIRSIIDNCDRKIKKSLTKTWHPISDEVRDNTLGFTFVFRHDFTFADADEAAEWNKLEEDAHRGGIYYRLHSLDEDD